MPLVAHPVRSLWGSQPRCARCVCEWLHRKWDGAIFTCQKLDFKSIQEKKLAPTMVCMDSCPSLLNRHSVNENQCKTRVMSFKPVPQYCTTGNLSIILLHHLAFPVNALGSAQSMERSVLQNLSLK